MTLIEQGLLISLLGLALTFAALGLLVLTIVILQRLFSAPEPAPIPQDLDVSEGLGEPTADVAAVIASAVVLLRSRDRSSSPLGQLLETGPSRWWQAVQPAPPPPRHRPANRRTEA